MKRTLQEKVKEELRNEGIFTQNDYTYCEYVESLEKLQKHAVETVMEDHEGFYRIADVISACKIKAHNEGLDDDPIVRKGIRALNKINKEMSVTMAGKSGENRVANLLSNLSRDDIKIYKNVYITDGKNETEMDDVIVTKNGIIILEVKTTKGDIEISSDGRIYKNGNCFHDYNIGEKMETKENLLGNYLADYMNENGFKDDILIDSCVVFIGPRDCRFKVKDNYHKVNYLYASMLCNKLSSYSSDINYSDEAYEQIQNAMSKLETNRKGFKLKYDSDKLIDDYCNLLVKLGYVEKENWISSIKEIFKKQNIIAGNEQNQIEYMKRIAFACSYIPFALAVRKTVH